MRKFLVNNTVKSILKSTLTDVKEQWFSSLYYPLYSLYCLQHMLFNYMQAHALTVKTKYTCKASILLFFFYNICVRVCLYNYVRIICCILCGLKVVNFVFLSIINSGDLLEIKYLFCIVIKCKINTIYLGILLGIVWEKIETIVMYNKFNCYFKV